MRSRVKKSPLRSLLGGLSALGLTLAALICLPDASAQYPGGGGYPGSTLGWKALPRPGAVAGSSGYSPSAFDWTGQDVTRTVTKYDGTVQDYSFSPKYGGGWGDSYPIEHPYQGTGGPYGVAHGHLRISGTSTYKWQWVPPDKPGTTTPDFDDFPAPALYVLGDVLAQVSATPTDPNNTVGLSGAGRVSDGFGDGWNPHFDTIPGAAPASLADALRRAVLPAAGGATASVGLSPYADLDVSGVKSKTDPLTGYPAAGGNAMDIARLSQSVHPIELTSPNVFKRPDTLGDGGNQLVYDSQQPDGELVVPAVVTVQGGNQDDATFATSHVDWALSPAIPNQVLPYVKYPYGNQVFAETPINSTTVTTGFVFRGLPERYNDFGNRTVIMTVDGSNSEVAHTQIFFGEKDLNWPNTDYIVDNWYHYYDQVYASPGEYEATSGPSYTQSYVDGLGFRGSEIHITDQAAGEWVVRVFGLKDSLSPYVIFLGTIETKGVHNYIETCAHEHGHADAWVSSTSADGFIEQSTTSDGDLVVTSYEDTHHLKSNTKDTTEAYAGLEPGDTEVLADIPALQPMLNHIANWHDDWSDAGLQYGTLYFSSPSGPPDFYWKFTPNTTTSVHMTPTGSPDSSGYYHIKNLEDIGNLYPGATILTTLRQLDPPS